MVPETEREKLYDKWYDLRDLYLEAVRKKLAAAEIAATKTMVDEAWDAYTACVTDQMVKVMHQRERR